MLNPQVRLALVDLLRPPFLAGALSLVLLTGFVAESAMCHAGRRAVAIDRVA